LTVQGTVQSLVLCDFKKDPVGIEADGKSPHDGLSLPARDLIGVIDDFDFHREPFLQGFEVIVAVLLGVKPDEVIGEHSPVHPHRISEAPA
jgi:hypothetical protein